MAAHPSHFPHDHDPLAAAPPQCRAPAKLLRALDRGLIPMHPGDYQAMASSVLRYLEGLRIDELVAIAEARSGALSELAENEVFDRACCLSVGERSHRRQAEAAWDELLERLQGVA